MFKKRVVQYDCLQLFITNPVHFMSSATVRYLVFDVESIADGDLISKVKYPDRELEGHSAIKEYSGELLERFNSEFIPQTYHIPVSIVAAKVDADFHLLDIVALDEPEYRSHKMVKDFWDGWLAYKKPVLVSFNGRAYDVPVLELAAFRYGLSIPEWFNFYGRNYEQPRNRFNQDAHLDLQDILCNFGASRLSGGLNLCANLIGSPGKMGVAGHMVQQLYDDGKLAEINNYCRCDVLDTYFVFLRAAVLIGKLTLEQERERVAETRQWLEERSDAMPVYAEYLEGCGEWENPWS